MAYATQTTVSTARTKAEIEDLLQFAGAEGFMSGVQGEKAMIVFQMNGKQIKFILNLPPQNSSKYESSPAGRVRYDVNQRFKLWEQDCRSHWRALLLCIRAKLEAYESGIETFEQAFLAHIILPSGSTLGETVIPQIEMGQMPEMNLGLPAPK